MISSHDFVACLIYEYYFTCSLFETTRKLTSHKRIKVNFLGKFLLLQLFKDLYLEITGIEKGMLGNIFRDTFFRLIYHQLWKIWYI